MANIQLPDDLFVGLIEDLLNFTHYYTEEIIKSDINFEKFLIKKSKNRDKFLIALEITVKSVYKRITDNLTYGTLQ